MSKTLTTTVAFTDPQGKVLANGVVIFQLNMGAKLISNGEVVNVLKVPFTLTSAGLMPAAQTIIANDELMPTGTFYVVTIFNSNGLLVRGPENWILNGTSPIDLSTITSSSIPDPGLASPVIQNPSAPQTITGQSLTLTSSAPLIVQGAATFTGGFLSSKLENIQIADQLAGGDCGAKINAADTALGTAAGEIWATQLCGTTWTTAVNVGAAGSQHTLRIFPGSYTTSAAINIVSTGSGITGSSPCARGTASGLHCPTIITEANGANLPALVALTSTHNVSFVENLLLDGNAANNPTGGVVLSTSTNGSDRIRGNVIRNAATHGISISGGCCSKLFDNMVIGSKADGIYSANSGDLIIGGSSEIENNGSQAVVNTSGSTITFVSGTAWSTDSSLFNTRVTLIIAGVASTFVVTASTATTLTVSQTIGTNSNITMLVGAGVECKDTAACQVTATADIGGNQNGYLNWGTSAGLGNSTAIVSGTHTIGNNKGWDILYLCFDTIGAAQTGNQGIFANNQFLGGTRAASNVFSEIKLQDCNNSIVSNNILQSSASARAGLEFAESASGRAGVNIAVNSYGSGWGTSGYIDNAAVNKSMTMQYVLGGTSPASILLPGPLYLGLAAPNGAQLQNNTGQAVSGITGTLFGWANPTVGWLGQINLSGDLGIAGKMVPATFGTATNCSVNSVSPAACGSAAAGSFVVPTTTTTYTVNTSAVKAASRILLMPHTDARDLPSAPTCTAVAAGFVGVSAISAATSFTFALPSTAGQTCWDYWIVN